MSERNVDLLAGVVLTLLGLLTLFYGIPHYVDKGFGFGLSPRFFPYVCVVAITGLSLALVVARLRRQPGGESASPLTARVLRQVLNVVLLMLVALAVMTYWSYLPAAMLLVASMMWYMGERRFTRIVPTAVVWPLLLWWLFERVLETPLPG
ncbi:tripartite tricarboxylate transporter TctB family protein [Marinobacter mangrovi]|uniref:tripartite tricarboxylate transporter TctB family protein n=1 Tax=Marinobacter mangrovi TaxID=2803918 RepID=UPI001933777F|nr:tripartite tricarboxylate transporter TctB family protein [Marinobacter mangrovi]